MAVRLAPGVRNRGAGYHQSQLRGAEAVIEKLPAVLPERAPANWEWLENKPVTIGLLMISTAAPYLAGYRKAFDVEAKRLNLNVIALDANNDPARQAAQADLLKIGLAAEKEVQAAEGSADPEVAEAIVRWCLGVVAAFGAFWFDTGSGYPQALQFLPLPLLLWSAMRFSLPGVAVDLFTNGSVSATVLGNVNGLKIPKERLDLD
jgi:hypothetical protein